MKQGSQVHMSGLTNFHGSNHRLQHRVKELKMSYKEQLKSLAYNVFLTISPEMSHSLARLYSHVGKFRFLKCNEPIELGHLPPHPMPTLLSPTGSMFLVSTCAHSYQSRFYLSQFAFYGVLFYKGWTTI